MMRALGFAAIAIAASSDSKAPSMYSRILDIDRPTLIKVMSTYASKKNLTLLEEERKIQDRLGISEATQSEQPAAPKPDDVEKVRPPDIGTQPDLLERQMKAESDDPIHAPGSKFSVGNFVFLILLLTGLSVAVIAFICFSGPFPKDIPVPVARDSDSDSELALRESEKEATTAGIGANSTERDTANRSSTRWSEVTLGQSNIANEDLPDKS